jgi:hypothetical protein
LKALKIGKHFPGVPCTPSPDAMLLMLLFM